MKKRNFDEKVNEIIKKVTTNEAKHIEAEKKLNDILGKIW